MRLEPACSVNVELAVQNLQHALCFDVVHMLYLGVNLNFDLAVQDLLLSYVNSGPVVRAPCTHLNLNLNSIYLDMNLNFEMIDVNPALQNFRVDGYFSSCSSLSSFSSLVLLLVPFGLKCPLLYLDVVGW